MFTYKIRPAVAGIAAAAIMLTALGPASNASASGLEYFANIATSTCSIQTINGFYLTAVGGGGRTTDVIHTNAVSVGAWELFKIVDSGDGSSLPNFGFQTLTGNYLTVVGGGGRETDVIHSNATQILGWEKITAIPTGGGWYALQTLNGHYLTAVGGGGRSTDAIHSDATAIGLWELFRSSCTR
jgi:hypothetical protein